MFFNKNGIEQGYHIIQNGDISPSINSNFIYDIERIDDSLFIATSAFGENYEGNPWGEFIIDTSGNIIQYESREGTAGSSHISKTFDNKYVIATSYWYPDLSYDIYFYKVNDSLEQDTVYPGNYTYDSLCPGQIQSGVIDLTGCTVITDIKDIPWKEDYGMQETIKMLEVYPNPSSGYVIIRYNLETETDCSIEIKDVTGKAIQTLITNGKQDQITVVTENWIPGVYIATLIHRWKIKRKCVNLHW